MGKYAFGISDLVGPELPGNEDQNRFSHAKAVYVCH